MSYGQPPHNPYGQGPPQGGYGYPPPQHQQQQQWGPPQGPPPGNWQQPPPGQWGPPQGGPPPGHYQQGPPQQWNAPPGPPPGQQQWGPPQGPPPGQQWGAPPGPPPNFQQGPPSPMPPHGAPPGQFGGPGGPGQPSPGYVPGMTAQGWNPEPNARALREAMKGFGTNEKALILVLAPLDPLQINSLRQAYGQIHPGRDLEKDIDSETSRYFGEALIAIVRGPLLSDAHNVRSAVVGAGTNEALLNHVVLGRTNADLRAIKTTYQNTFKRRMEDDVDGDLSMKTKDLFRIVLRADRAENNTPVVPQQVDRDVAELTRALTSSGEQVAVCNVLALRSDGQLRAIAQAYEQRNRKPLREALKKKFDGHMEDALLLMLDRAVDPVMSDAVQLEAAMAGLGTKDRLLVHRTVAVHWDRAHKDQVKRAYQQRFKKDLVERIRGETSGDYRSLLIACMQ